MFHECHQGMNGIPQGMKIYPIQFSRFPNYENLQIIYLFDTMHIGKNITELLWRILDWQRKNWKDL